MLVEAKKRVTQSSIIDAVNSIFPKKTGNLSLHEPYLNQVDLNNVIDCVESGWVSSVGSYVNKFERAIEQALNVPHAVVVSSGTAGLFIALKLAGVQNDDEVIVPTVSFVATANAVAHLGAIPHFVDSEPNYLGIDLKRLHLYLKTISKKCSDGLFNKYSGKRISAIVPVHILGHPVNMPALLEIAEEFGLPIIEDAAESLGSVLNGKSCGTFGKMGVISFNGNKIVTTGGGGAIVTSDTTLAEKARHLTTTAKKQHAWEFYHDQIAYNMRMPNINAALGYGQLQRLPSLVESKRKLAKAYEHVFRSISGVKFIKEPKEAYSNYWLNAISIENSDYDFRNEVLDTLHQEGFQVRPIWELLHKLPMYQNCPRMETPNAELLSKQIICLPSSPKLAEDNFI